MVESDKDVVAVLLVSFFVLMATFATIGSAVMVALAIRKVRMKANDRDNKA